MKNFKSFLMMMLLVLSFGFGVISTNVDGTKQPSFTTEAIAAPTAEVAYAAPTPDLISDIPVKQFVVLNKDITYNGQMLDEIVVLADNPINQRDCTSMDPLPIPKVGIEIRNIEPIIDINQILIT